VTSSVYLDSSALVKLVIGERESAELGRFLTGDQQQVSCAVVRTEVPRAIRRQRPHAAAQAADVLAPLALVAVDGALLEDAVAIEPMTLRTLDAIHLAAALTPERSSRRSSRTTAAWPTRHDRSAWRSWHPPDANGPSTKGGPVIALSGDQRTRKLLLPMFLPVNHESSTRIVNVPKPRL